MTLYRRTWQVSLAGLTFTELTVRFTVSRSLEREPNKASIEVVNLGEAERQALVALNIYVPRKTSSAQAGASKATTNAGRLGRIPVELSAGYDQRHTLIFRGFLERADIEFAGADVLTRIEGEDGGVGFFGAGLSQSFPKGTRKTEVARALIQSLGVGLGNFAEVERALGSSTFPNGTVVYGPAHRNLADLLRPFRLRYSIQQGSCQFQVIGAGVEGRRVQALRLAPDSGLLGWPKRASTGEVVVQTLMLPGADPGSYVVLATGDASLDRTYRIVRVETRGDTDGQEWGHVITLLPG